VLLALALTLAPAALAQEASEDPAPLVLPAVAAEQHRRRSIGFTWAGRAALVGGEIGLLLLYRIDRPTVLQKGLYGYVLPALSTGCVFWATAEATWGLKALGAPLPRPVLAAVGLGVMAIGYPLALWAQASARSREAQFTILAVTQAAGIGGIQLHGFLYRWQLRPGAQTSQVRIRPFAAPLPEGLMAGAAVSF